MVKKCTVEQLKRLLSIVLCMAMLVSNMPLTFAEEIGGNPPMETPTTALATQSPAANENGGGSIDAPVPDENGSASAPPAAEPTEAPTAAPTAVSTEAPTAPEGDESTEAPTAPAEYESTEAPTAPAEGDPTEAPTAPAEGDPTEAPAVPEGDNLTEAPTVPAEGEPTEVPTEPVDGEPTDAPAAPYEEESTDATPVPSGDAPGNDADLPSADDMVPGDDMAPVADPVTYTVTVTAGEHVSIADSAYPVAEGASVTIEWTIEDGFTLASVKTDGSLIDTYAWDEATRVGSVTFADVTADHSLEVTAEAAEALPELHPMLQVEITDTYEDDPADGFVHFDVAATASLPEDEELPEGAEFVFSYQWQSATRNFSNDNSWTDRPNDPQRELIDDEFNSFYTTSLEDGGRQLMMMALPDGADRRSVLADTSVRCVVTVEVVKDGAVLSAEPARATTERKQYQISSDLLNCEFSLSDEDSVTNPIQEDQDIVFAAKPVLTNAPIDTAVTYSYTWQVYVSSLWGGGTWRAYDDRRSPIRNMASLSADGTTLTIPMPQLLDDREALQGLEVRCVVTANGYPVTPNEVTHAFTPVEMDQSLLEYRLTVTSDNSGAAVTTDTEPIRMAVTPKLSGVASTFKTYTYQWQYQNADGAWVAIDRDDENCPVRFAAVSATSNASNSTLTLALPDNMDSRRNINGTKVRCFVTATKSGVEYEVLGEEATITIPADLLTAFHMDVAEDTAKRNTQVSYAAQPVYVGYIPTVTGDNAAEAVVTFHWSYKAAGSASFQSLTAGTFAGGSFVTNGNGWPTAYRLVAPDANVLRAIDGATIRCYITLHAHGDAFASGEAPELEYSHEVVIGVDSFLVEDYPDKAPWMTDAWLEIIPNVKSDAITNVGMTALMEVDAKPNFSLDKGDATDRDENYAIAVKDGFYNGTAYHHLWEYREMGGTEWRPVSSLPESIRRVITLTYGEGIEAGKTSIEVALPADYASRIQLSGMQFRCTSSALAMAVHTGDENKEWGVITESIPDDRILTVIINPKLLRSQASSTRRIVAFLNKEAADAYLALSAEERANYVIDPANYYDYSKSYEVLYFEDGVREERAMERFPTSIVAVYEYQVEENLDTVTTKMAAVEIPVPWRFILESGRAYDLSATKAQYRYDAALAQVIPQWNAEALQDYINTHPDPSALDYDEDDAVRWVVAASLNGRYPHIRVCWNTELMKLSNRNDYTTYNSKYSGSGNAYELEKVAAMAGSLVNPYWKQTYSDWFFKSAADYNGDNPTADQLAQKRNSPTAEADQLAWLEANYPTVRVLMEDVRSELDDPTPVLVELPVTWRKVEVKEYDSATQSLTARWLGDAAVGILQGETSPASKWVWRATINDVASGRYVLANEMRYTNIEATFYWSRVIDAIVGALPTPTSSDTISALKISNAAAFAGKIPQALRVELKDANGGLNVVETLPVTADTWKLVEGRVYDASQEYHWRHLEPECASITDEVGTTATAGVLAIQPTLDGYTFTDNADTELARVWYQWGTIITSLTKADGTPYDAITAAKTPLLTINIANTTDKSLILWSNLTSNASYLKKQFNVETLDKTSASGYSTLKLYADWGAKPAIHDEASVAGMSQPAANFEKPASGQVFDEALVREFNGRQPYADISWKLNTPSGNINNGKIISTLAGGRVKINGAAGQKVAYSDAAWDMVASVLTSPGAAPSSGQVGLSFPGYDTFYHVRDNVYYKLSSKPAGGGYYVQYDITAQNRSNADRWVGFAMGADVMIHNSDNADIIFTNTGFAMKEVTGDFCQFNILLHNSISGIGKTADTRNAMKYPSRGKFYWSNDWAGGRHGGTNQVIDGNPAFGGVDSELTFSWLPKNYKLAPGESTTFTCMFGVGKVSEPPLINPVRTTATANGSKVDVTAYMAGATDTKLQLYYRFDEGLPTETNEISVGSLIQGKGVASLATLNGYTPAQKQNYYATSEHFFSVNTQIEKPRNWVAGEYHSITLFVVNDAGSLSESITIPLFVIEDENGDEILSGATEATVSFSKGAGGGTAPAPVTAHLQEPITLPKIGSMTAPSGYKFVGWDYTRMVDDASKTTTYPADAYFYIERDGIVLTAKWIPTSQTMYLIETYMQLPDGQYEQEETVVGIDAGTGNIVYTPEAKRGYTINSENSKLTVARADGAKILVYYDILKYDVEFNTNGAPGGDENGVFRTMQAAYGSNVSGVPNAAALNAGQNNKYFRFVGWFDEADTITNPDAQMIDTSTVVNEHTLRNEAGENTADPGAKLVAYAKWTPLNNAQITFDYAYKNHAQGAVRSDKRTLTPIYDSTCTGLYSYNAKPSGFPVTPSAWKDTSGNVYTFVEWRIDPEDPATAVNASTVLQNYEDVTVTAIWTESYSVSRSYRGEGRVYDINDPAGGVKSYTPGDTAEIRWQAAPGYFVEHVTIDGENRDDLISTGWHQENIRENHSVYVVFSEGEGNGGISEETLYDITATPVGGIAFDVPERGGTYRAHFGETYTVKWRVSPGYVLSEYTINGIPYEVDDAIRASNSFTFNDIHTAQEIVVTAVREGATEGGNAQLNRGPYPITTKIAKGTSITPGASVNWKSDYTVNWRIPSGFIVETVIVNNLILSTLPEGNSYTFRNVSMPSSIVVMCGPDPNLPVEAVYVTTTIDYGGTITPTTPANLLSKGDNHTVTWSTDAKHYVKAVYIDDVLQKTASGANKIYYSHTFENIQEPHDVVVELGEITSEMHAITTEIVNGGTIDKPGSVVAGTDVTVNWVMAANHRVKAVYLDGEPVNDYNSETDGNSYTIADVQAPHTLKVECERIPVDVDMTDKWIVTTTINLGSADGQKIVANGESCTVNWTPPKDYHVTSLKVDGVAQTYVTGNSWTIPSVTKNMKVEVTVAKDADAPTYTIEEAIVNGGTITGGGTFAVGMGSVMRWTVADGFRVTDVNIDGVSVSGIDLERDRSYQFPASMGAAGQTYRFNVVCAPKLYYHVRPTGTGVENLTASADVFLGNSHTVSWKVADQYRFKSVTVNGTEVTPVISGDTYSYTFDTTNTAANATYNVVVTCEKIPSFTITTGRNSGGSVSASKTLYETDADRTYTVTWHANSGYRVKSVLVDEGSGEVAYTGAEYVFRYEDGRNVSLRVEFEPQQYYTVKAKGNNTNVTPSTATYTVDEDGSVAWTKPDGFVLTGLTVNGAEVAFTQEQTSYTVDHTTVTPSAVYEVVVTYAPESSVPEEPEAFYHIVTSGVFTSALTDSYDVKLGEDGTVTWRVLDGYRLSEVKVDGVAVTPSVTEAGVYSVSISGQGREDGDTVPVAVVCERIPSGEPGGGGEVITPYSVYAFTNDASLGAVSPAAATLREDGATAAVTWTPKKYAHVVSVTISDYPSRANAVTADAAMLAAGSYTFQYDEHQDKIVDVVFEADPAYTITAEAAGTTGAGCAVSVGGTNPLKGTGEAASVTWTVGTGYTVTSVVISDEDGTNAVNATAAELSAKKIDFSYDTMTANRKVVVTYDRNTTGVIPYTVRAKANDAAMGTVSPASRTLTAADSTATVTWSAKPGYHVASVTVTDYPDANTVQSLTEDEIAAGSYVFAYNEHEDKLVYVVFEQDPVYDVSIVGVNGGADCTVTGGATLTASGQTHMVTWTAGTGYTVKSVVIADPDGANAQNLTAAQMASGSYTFSYDTLHSDRKVTVTFEKSLSSDPPIYAVTTAVNDAAMGTVSPSASLSAEGATYAVAWRANPGYTVKRVTVNGTDYAADTYTFRYNDHADTTVYVEFEALPAYQITTAKVGGGASSTVREGTTLTTSGSTYAVTWSADSGFKVESVVIANNMGDTLATLTEAEIAAGKYTFAYDDMTGDVLLTVTFAVDTSSEGGAGTTPYAVTTQVIPADGSMGTIDPSKTLRREGEEYVVSWNANPGYRVKRVTVDDGENATAYTGTDYTFRYENHKDVTITVEFEQIPQYTVTADKQGNGGANSVVSAGAVLAPNQSHTVTWLAGEGYNVRSVVISKPDGTDRKQLSESEIALGAYTFTYDGMNGSDRKIVVTFEKDEGTIPGGGDLPATPYTVETSVNDAAMGTVSPSKTLNTADSEYLVTWSANPGYYIKSVAVNGVGRAISEYTFKYNDHRDTKVVITFAPIVSYTVTGVAVGGGANSTVTPASAVLSGEGDTQTVTWTADEGYRAKSAVVTNANGRVVYACTEEEVASGSYTFYYDDMSSDQTMTVTFEKVEGAGATPYTVTTSVNDSSMGSIDPSVTLRTAGAQADIHWRANNGYTVKSVTITDDAAATTRNATEEELTAGKLTFLYDDHKDLTVNVVFEAIPSYKITAAKVGGGAGSSVTPASAVLAASGESATFTWTADTAYLVESVSIRNAAGTELESLDAAAMAAGSYTFAYDDLDGDRTIIVTFKKDDNPGGLTPLAYSISTGKTGNGTISDSKSLNTPGDTYTVTWKPAEGWYLNKVTLKVGDGEAQEYTDADMASAGITVDASGMYSYTFYYDNHQDVQLHAEFVQYAELSITTVKAGSAGLSAFGEDAVLTKPGETHTVNWTVDSGYRIESIVITDAESNVLKTFDQTEADALSYAFSYEGMNGVSQVMTITYAKEDTDPDAPVVYSLVTSVNDAAMGTITPGVTKTSDDAPYSVTWSANEGYHVKEVKHFIDGVEAETVPAPGYEYHYGHDEEIQVIFEANPNRTVNVSVTGSGTAAAPKVMNKAGETYKVWWQAADGAEVERVTVTGYPPLGGGAATVLTAADITDEGSGKYSYTVAYDAMTADVTVDIVFREKDHYFVTASATNAAISADKAQYELDETATVTWLPAAGMRLVSVKVDGVEQPIGDGAMVSLTLPLSGATPAPDQVYHVDVVYEAEASSGDPETYQVNVTATGTQSHTGSASVTVGDDYAITWKPMDGYTYKGVTVSVDGSPVVVDASAVTGDAENGYAYTVASQSAGAVVTVDILCELETEPDPDEPEPVYYTVTTSKNGNGTITPSTTLSAPDTTADIVWTADPGWHVASVVINGETVTDDAVTSYTFAYNDGADATVHVVFEQDPAYVINVAVEGEGTAAGAGIIRSTDADAENHQVTWMPAAGWHVSKVTVNGTRLTGEAGSYTVKYSELTGDVNIKVVLERDEPVLPPTEETSYTVNTAYTGNGSITDGVTLTEEDGPYTIVWTPAEGWYVKAVKVVDENGSESDFTGDSYVFRYEDHENVTVRAEFAKYPEYSISAVIDAGGTIAPTTAAIAKGDAAKEITWSISDTERYAIKSVMLNGTPLNASDYTKADGSYGYTFDYDALFQAGMPESITLKVELEEEEQPVTPVQYVVSTQMTPNGAGSISGTAMVVENDNYTVVWAADSAYKVTKVEVTENGVTSELAASDTGSYTFRQVNSNCAIVVTCEEREPIIIEDEVFFNIISGINGGVMSDGKTIRSVRKGDDYTLSWTPDLGNYIASVVVDGVEVPVCSSYTFTDVQADHTIQINCLNTAVSELYYVNVSAGTAITNGNSEVPVGTDHTVTWRPALGEHIVSVTVNGVQVPIGDPNAGGSYTITGAAKDEVYDIVVTSEANPPVEPDVTYYDVTVTVKNATYTGETHLKAGESTTIAWMPEFGYEVKSITIDDSGRPLTLESFTIANIDRDHTITIICERIGSEEPDPEAEYLISTQISDGGAITAPITVRTAEEKASQTVIWTAPDGYRVVSVKVDSMERADLIPVGSVTFTNISRDHTVEVACERLPKYTITVRNDNGAISASPETVAAGGTSVVTWSGLAGFVLESVEVDGTVVTDADYTDNGNGTYGYTFTNVAADHSVVVTYVPGPDVDPDTLYITTHIDHGVITETVVIPGNDEAAKASQTITWTPADGYRVAKVEIDGAEVTDADGTYTFTDITQSHTVNVTCERSEAYKVSTNGKNVLFITPSKDDLAAGASFTVTWTPADGLTLKSFKVDGKETALDEGATSYTFDNITADHTLYVEYGAQTEETPDRVEVSVMVTGGTKTGGGIMNYGTASHTVTWTPLAGNVVKSVIIDDAAVPEDQIIASGGSITFKNIVSDHSVVVVCGPADGGEEPDDTKVYLETNIVNGIFSFDDDREINDFGVYEMEKGADFDINWTPNSGFKVVSVKLDGIERSDLMQAGKLVLKGVNGDHTLTVECRDENDEPITTGPFTISTSIDHGAISAPYTTTGENESYTVSWTADSKYEIVSVTVDGNPYINWRDGYISFNPITANHTVEVRSQLKDQPADTYVIDVIVDNGGSGAAYVDDIAVDYVTEGESVTAKWNAAPNYDIVRVVIDGSTAVGLPGFTLNSGVYTFNNVTANHTIMVYTAKHVEKDPVYYSLTVLPYGDPSGLELSESLPAILEGTETAVKWKAKSGWQIDKVTRNGNILSSADMLAGMSEAGFKLTVNSNNDFVVYVSQQGPADTSFVTVSTEVSNGWVSNGAAVKKGSNFNVSWRPNNGYVVVSVTVTDKDGHVLQRIADGLRDPANWQLKVTNIQTDITVKVDCVAQPETEEPIVYSYDIVTEATNGTITGGGTVNAGENRTITWDAASGCLITSIDIYRVNEDGEEELVATKDDLGDASSYDITGIDSDYRIVLVCENPVHADDDYYYDVSTSITNGTINGPFLNLRKAETVAVEWSPAADCYVTAVKVDGVNVPIPADNRLEVAVEGEDHTVEVICEKKKAQEIPDDATSYTIEAYIHDGMGQISPKQVVLGGTKAIVSWTVDSAHYKVARVYVDGELVETPSSNMLYFDDVAANHVVDVYLSENLVDIKVSYEGDGDVVKSGTVYYGEDFGIVRGVPNDGYRLETVKINGVILQPGQIMTELLPPHDMPLPGEPQARQNQLLAYLRNSFTAQAEDVDYSKYTSNNLQNTFYFKDVTAMQTVEYVFVDDGGTGTYKPYQVSVELIDGRGDRDVNKWVEAGANDSIGWSLEDGYYVDHVAIVRNGAETDITMLDDAKLVNVDGKDKVNLSNIQADTVVKVYLKRGEQPDPMDKADFSLSIDVVGPGSADPDIRVYGAGHGMTAGDHVASWDIGAHKITMIKVDNVIREDLMDKNSVTITMKREDVVRDHSVIIYLDGVVVPMLEKSAGTKTGATVGDTIPYTITVSNETNQAIWKGVTLTDRIPDGLTLQPSTLKLYRVKADGTKVAISGASYDAATRTVKANVGDIRREDKFELSFSAKVDVGADKKDIGNSVTAAGTNSGTNDPVVVTAGKVYPGGKDTVLPKNPAPHITKKAENADASSTRTRVGDKVNYTIDIWNSEPGSVWKSVKVQDDLPNGLEMVDGSLRIYEVTGLTPEAAPDTVSVAYDPVNRRISATLGDIGYEEHYRICFSVTVTKAAVGSDIGNIALAAGQKPDKTPESIQTDPVYPQEIDKPENGGVLPPAPAPEVIKTAVNLDRANAQSQVGDRLQYTITVRNSKPETVWKNAVIRDRIPAGLAIDTTSITLDSGAGPVALSNVYTAADRMLSVYVGDIPYGTYYTLTFTATLTESVEDVDIGNIAWAKGKDPALEGGNDPIPNAPPDIKPGDWYNPGGSDWPDNGAVNSDKAYPNEGDKPIAAGAKIAKSVRNATRPEDLKALPGDMLEYEIEISNTQAGSQWKDVVIVDTLPKTLDVSTSKIFLIKPDGMTETLELADVYDAQTHTLTVRLPGGVRKGGTYWLRYTAMAVRPAQDVEPPTDIVNKVTATGRDVAGNQLRVDAQHALAYEVPKDDTPRTGDDTDIMRYVVMLLASGCTLIACELDRRRRRKALEALNE